MWQANLTQRKQDNIDDKECSRRPCKLKYASGNMKMQRAQGSMIKKAQIRPDSTYAKANAMSKKKKAHVTGHNEGGYAHTVLVMLTDQQPHDDHAETEYQRLADYPKKT